MITQNFILQSTFKVRLFPETLFYIFKACEQTLHTLFQTIYSGKMIQVISDLYWVLRITIIEQVFVFYIAQFLSILKQPLYFAVVFQGFFLLFRIRKGSYFSETLLQIHERIRNWWNLICCFRLHKENFKVQVEIPVIRIKYEVALIRVHFFISNV